MPTAELTRPFVAQRARVVLPGAARPARRDLASALGPAGRPGDRTDAVAHRRLVPFDPAATASTWLLARALARLRPAERRRVVEGWRDHDRGRERPLVVDEGCDLRPPAATGDDVRSALLEWLPAARSELVVFDGGLCADDPADALTLLLRPPTIWPLDRALAAARLHGSPASHGSAARFDPACFEALERRGMEWVGAPELRRARAAVRRLREQLASHPLPLAVATVAAGCAVAETDDARCAALAACQLARYASSTLVSHRLRR